MNIEHCDSTFSFKLHDSNRVPVVLVSKTRMTLFCFFVELHMQEMQISFSMGRANAKQYKANVRTIEKPEHEKPEQEKPVLEYSVAKRMWYVTGLSLSSSFLGLNRDDTLPSSGPAGIQNSLPVLLYRRKTASLSTTHQEIPSCSLDHGLHRTALHRPMSVERCILMHVPC